MNAKKLKLRENRLNQVKTKVEARRKVLQELGKDKKLIEKDSVLRHLRADFRKVKRSIESLQDKPAEKPVKATKPPKEKKPKEKKSKEKKPEEEKPKEEKPKEEKPKEEKPKKEEEAPTE